MQTYTYCSNRIKARITNIRALTNRQIKRAGNHPFHYQGGPSPSASVSLQPHHQPSSVSPAASTYLDSPISLAYFHTSTKLRLSSLLQISHTSFLKHTKPNLSPQPRQDVDQVRHDPKPRRHGGKLESELTFATEQGPYIDRQGDRAGYRVRLQGISFWDGCFMPEVEQRFGLSTDTL
jgi:hypothetical protein